MTDRTTHARRARRGIGAFAAVALVAATLAFNPLTSTSGAATQVKTLQGTCAGADAASSGLLAALGGSLTVPFEVVADVPGTLQPEESGSPISFTWKVTLSETVSTTAAGIDPTLTVKNLVLDTKVDGPTGTKLVQGRPADLVLNLVAGQATSLTQGPFTGTLTEVGKGGIIRYSPAAISFTISLDISGKATDVNVTCQAPGTIATTAIKIPGSPDIKPIAVTAAPNTTVNVDVLGQFVTPGTDEKGVQRPVDPSSLKVLDGPGTVTGGQVAVAAGAAGSASSVTFEVCSGTLPGVNEVQRIVLDATDEATKKGVGFTLKYKDAETPVIFTVQRNAFTDLWGALIGIPATFQKPVSWVNEANGYIATTFTPPEASAVQAALATLPGLAGGVQVTRVTSGLQPGQIGYDVEFTGANGERDVDSLTIGSYYSVFPQETLASIIDAAQGLLGGGGGGGGGTTTTTIPIADLQAQFDEALRIDLSATPPKLADFDKAGQLFGQIIQANLRGALADINVQEVVQGLTALFPKAPELTTQVAGDTPIGICSQGIIDVTVAGATVGGATLTATPGAGVGGASRTAGAPIRITG